MMGGGEVKGPETVAEKEETSSIIVFLVLDIILIDYIFPRR